MGSKAAESRTQDGVSSIQEGTSARASKYGQAIAVVGAQWGDEGKGKIIDSLAHTTNFVVRFQGGANAGHTINNSFGRFALHLLPSGVFYPDVINILGPGVALNVRALLKEHQMLIDRGVAAPKLLVSDKAQVVLPHHILLDAYQEEGATGRAFGSTKQGISPFYSAKYAKRGIRVGILFDEKRLREEVEEALHVPNILFQEVYKKPTLDTDDIVQDLLEQREMLRPFVADTTELLLLGLEEGKTVLLEGQLGTLRDPDHGIYPYSTSSSTLAGFATVGAGIPPKAIQRVIAVVKAYSSKVGDGPFVAGIADPEEAQKLRLIGGDKGEFGTLTGRPRDVGYFDAVATRYGVRVQGATEIALTNLDVMGYLREIPICTGYKIDGKVTREFPSTHLLYNAEPVFESVEGWNCAKEELQSIRQFSDLPPQAQAYVAKIEELCGAPVTMVSVGPGRDDIIYR